jgi:hypothetical protein
MRAGARPRRGPLERLAAWYVTGPLGHLVGGVADWAALLVRYLWARARGREPWREGG